MGQDPGRRQQGTDPGNLPGTAFDLAECLTEPIHLLGGIQSYGALLALTEPDLTIVMASANTGSMLGVTSAALVGTAASDLLGADGLRQLREALDDANEISILLTLDLQVAGQPRRFDIGAHRGDGLLICDIEPAVDQEARFSSFYPNVRRALLQLRGAQTVDDLCRLAVRQLRAFTGYDRVVAYRFDGEGPGEVIAEDLAGDREPWLGLWFPASDVPPQARELYRQNWIRVIADVDDTSVGLVPALRPGTGRPLDLSGSALRTVSAFHLEYLRNLGVRASMSVSLVKDERLWGLLACHSDLPLRLGPDQRAACEMFGIALSLQLAALDDRQRAAGESRARSRLQQLVVTAGGTSSSSAGDHLVQDSRHLLDVVPADGVYLHLGGVDAAHGLTPDPTDLASMLAHLPVLPAGRIWSTDRLGDELGGMAHLTGGCAGMLMVRLSAGDDVLIWFREETARKTSWAADPSRPVTWGRHGERLTPRGSSATWHESVRGRCTPWSAEDLGVAEEVYRALFEVTLGRARELSRSNEELGAFAYAASHDLKEPVRGIATYAAFIDEDATDLDDTTRARLEMIRKLALRMDGLLESMLQFSRAGHLEPGTGPVALDDVVDDIEELLGPALAAADVEFRRLTPLGTVPGDRLRLQEVLVNLISNAIKYAADDPPRWVAIGLDQATPPGEKTPKIACFIRDNGIGIPLDQQDKIFELFRRLHPQGARGGGSGAGLAISRRIVERHGGSLWVESAPGSGSTFFFTLP